MLKINRSHTFNENYKECINKYKDDICELDNVIYILASGHKLHKKYKDHALDKYKELKGKGYRDCHIVTVDEDWILIYKPSKHNLFLIYTGSHKNFFKY